MPATGFLRPDRSEGPAVPPASPVARILARRWGARDGRAFLEAEGKQAVQLRSVAPAKGGNQHTASAPEDTKRAPAHEKRIRAIAERAPEPVRELYREVLHVHGPRCWPPTSKTYAFAQQ